ncbi:hypothetical protein Leryth_023310, partial [Lithospermum erythrorhizon]
MLTKVQWDQIIAQRAKDNLNSSRKARPKATLKDHAALKNEGRGLNIYFSIILLLFVFGIVSFLHLISVQWFYCIEIIHISGTVMAEFYIPIAEDIPVLLLQSGQADCKITLFIICHFGFTRQ